MRVSEERRRALFERVRAHLDEETATLLLEVTVPANVELATRGDIQELRAEMLLAFARIDARFGAQDARMDRLEARMDALDARMDALDARMDALDVRLTGRLYRVVIPVLATWNLLIVAIATWVGTLIG